MSRQRLRITFRSEGPIKYVGHLDLALVWERALRRAKLPLLYSQGFHSQPKMQFAAVLPVGVSGREELLDVWLSPPQAPEKVEELLQPALPRGLYVLTVQEVPLKGPATQTLVRSAEYRIWVECKEPEAQFCLRLDELLSRQEIILTRRRKKQMVSYNLRPLVQDVRFLGPEEGGYAFFVRLRSESGATGRPDAVLEAMKLAEAPRRIERLRLLGEGLIVV